MTKKEREDFTLFCKQATDRQLLEIYRKESKWIIREKAKIAYVEIYNRGLEEMIL